MKSPAELTSRDWKSGVTWPDTKLTLLENRLQVLIQIKCYGAEIILPHHLCRRHALKLLAGTSLAATGGASFWPEQALSQVARETGVSGEFIERALVILKANPSIDLHNHLGYWETKGIDPAMEPATYQGDASTLGVINAMIDSHAKCGWICLTGDVPLVKLGEPGNKVRDYEADEAWQEYQRQMSILRAFLVAMPIQAITSGDDIEPTFATGSLAVMMSTEGGHMVEKDLDRLEILKADGITKFQPIHYLRTSLGDNQTDPSAFGGLSTRGKEAIRRAAKLGMVIDVAHASYDGAKHMADLTGVPLMLSHTMMKFGPYLDNRARFITADYAFLVAQTGGVIGTWTVGEPIGVRDLPTFIEGVTRLVDTVGVDHVGWSTDYITFAQPNWFKTYEAFPTLCGGLLQAGFSDQDLVKFVGGNALRVMGQAAAG